MHIMTTFRAVLGNARYSTANQVLLYLQLKAYTMSNTKKENKHLKRK